MSVLMTLSDVIDYHDEVREGNFLKCYFFWKSYYKLCLSVVKRQVGGQNFNVIPVQKTPVYLDNL